MQKFYIRKLGVPAPACDTIIKSSPAFYGRLTDRHDVITVSISVVLLGIKYSRILKEYES